MAPPIKVQPGGLLGAAGKLSHAAREMSDVMQNLPRLSQAVKDPETFGALHAALAAWTENLSLVQAGATSVANAVKLAAGVYPDVDARFADAVDPFPTRSPGPGDIQAAFGVDGRHSATFPPFQVGILPPLDGVDPSIYSDDGPDDADDVPKPRIAPPRQVPPEQQQPMFPNTTIRPG